MDSICALYDINAFIKEICDIHIFAAKDFTHFWCICNSLGHSSLHICFALYVDELN